MISNVRKNRKDNDKKHRYQIFNRIFMEYQNSTEDIEVVKLINIRNYRIINTCKLANMLF